jgi:hypothetical protein
MEKLDLIFLERFIFLEDISIMKKIRMDFLYLIVQIYSLIFIFLKLYLHLCLNNIKYA